MLFTWAEVDQQRLGLTRLKLSLDPSGLSLGDERHTLLMEELERALLQYSPGQAQVKAPGQARVAVVDDQHSLSTAGKSAEWERWIPRGNLGNLLIKLGD